MCPKCNAHNYASKMACYKCRESKPRSEIEEKAVSSSRSGLEKVQSSGEAKKEGRASEDTKDEGPPTTVVCVHNIIEKEDLEDMERYKEIMEENKTEFEKYGELEALIIPKDKDDEKGIGNVYANFKTVESAKKAIEAVRKREFDGKAVVASYFSPEKLESGTFE